MSRIGRDPIDIPKGVEVNIKENVLTVKGPKGTSTQSFKECILVEIEGSTLFVKLKNGCEGMNNFQGLYRSLFKNMIEGSIKHFEKKLEMIGVGYRSSVKGKALDVQVGLSHPLLINIPEGINVKVDKSTFITVSGHNKQEVGEFAAQIRSKRPPEPYKGKGIRYVGEYVRKKAGKSAKAGK